MILDELLAEERAIWGDDMPTPAQSVVLCGSTEG